MNRKQIINCDPDIQDGAPVFSGTRVPVRTFIDYLKAGDNVNDFLDGFPSVKPEQALGFLDIAFTTASGNRINARAA